MTLKEIVERQKTTNYGRIKRASNDDVDDYIIFDNYLTALDKNGFLKTFTEEELEADDWEIY